MMLKKERDRERERDLNDERNEGEIIYSREELYELGFEI